jgi:predicted nucleotidyltransferase
MTKTRILLRTEHGSHLYGLATPTSDLDFYEIFEYPWLKHRPKKQVFQTITNDEDVTEASLDRFVDMCFKGIPQALEALFSSEDHWVEYHTSWYDKREYIAFELPKHKEAIVETYKRTTLNFLKSEEFKRDRHALRLMLNITDFKNHGDFNPTLSETQCEEITRIAVLPRNRREEIFKDMFFNTFK